MYAPIDQHTPAGLRFGGKCAAKTGDGAKLAKRAVDVIDLAESPVGNHLRQFFHGGKKAIAYADVKNFAAFFRLLRHFEGKRIVYGDRFFTKNVFARRQRLHRNRIVRKIRRQHPYGFHLAVSQHGLIIGHRVFDKRILFFCGKRLFGDQIARVFNPYLPDFRKGRKMGVVRNPPAPDHTDTNFFHFSFLRLSEW